jgi:hypothetical protein
VRGLAILTIAYFAAGAAVAQGSSAVKGGQTYQGGPWDGLSTEGQSEAPTRPSIANASPVPAADAPLVTRLVASLSSGRRSGLRAFGPAGAGFCLDAKGRPCGLAAKLSDPALESGCRINTPYFLASYNKSIRLEWVCGGRVAFIAFAKLANGKLSALEPERPVAVLRVPTHG